MDSDDDLPPLESDTHVATVHYSRRSLLALNSPEEPAAAKRPEQPSALTVGGRQAVPRRAEERRLRRRRSDDGRRVAQEGRALAGGRPHVPIDRKGVRRRKPRPRPPATLIKKERYDCGYSSAPDEPSNGAEQRRRSLEYQTPPRRPSSTTRKTTSSRPKVPRARGLRAPFAA